MHPDILKRYYSSDLILDFNKAVRLWDVRDRFLGVKSAAAQADVS